MSKTEQTVPNSGSKIFDGFRILGLVSNDIPCLLRYIHSRQEYFVISCVGRSFNTFAVSISAFFLQNFIRKYG